MLVMGMCVCVCFLVAAPQWGLPHREAAEHEEGDPLHRQSVQKGQDLAEEDQAQQERVPDLSSSG